MILWISANSLFLHLLSPLSTLPEKAMAPNTSTLAWKIPWMEEPGGLQSMGSLRVGHDWTTSLSLFTCMHWRKEMATHSSVLAWRSPGTGEPGGLPSTGSRRVRHDWRNLAATGRGQVCITKHLQLLGVCGGLQLPSAEPSFSFWDLSWHLLPQGLLHVLFCLLGCTLGWPGGAQTTSQTH